MGTVQWPTPIVEAMGSGASIWATSKWPIDTRSRMFAHDNSRVSCNSSPSAAANPFSAATISTAASSSGMKPARTTSRSVRAAG